jgi:hypothetical protein
MNSRKVAVSPMPRPFSLRSANKGVSTPAILFSGETSISVEKLKG